MEYHKRNYSERIEAMILVEQDFWFLVEQCGVDSDQLGSHWAAYQLMVRYHGMNEDEANDIVQEYGWH